MSRLLLLVAAFVFAFAACPDSTTDPSADTSASDGVPSEAPTYWNSVKAIVDTNCVSCHFPGGAGPFPMDTYAAILPYAGSAKVAIENGSMPPWMPDPTCRTFKGQRVVTDADKATYAAWIAAGAPEGDEATYVAPTLDPIPQFTATHVAHMATAYTPDVTKPDDYRCFVLDLDFPETMYVAASQVVPGHLPIVHHVLVYGVSGDSVAVVEQAQVDAPGPGYDCFGGPVPDATTASTAATTLMAGWVPGATPIVGDSTVGTRIAKGSVLVMQIHYNTLSAKPAADDTTVEVIMSTTEPTTLAQSRPLVMRDLTIPAGDPAAMNSATVPYYGTQPLELAGLGAHMHLLGSSLNVELVRADGSEECLISVPKWDFNWQQTYSFLDDERVTLKNGDALRLTCVYDNSAENQPTVNGQQVTPTDVGWGEGTLDEMCISYLRIYTPFTAEVTDPAQACAGAQAACAAGCSDPTSLDCVMNCAEAGRECHLCIAGTAEGCAGTCGLALLAARDCYVNCGTATFTLGTNLGACMQSECATEYEAMVSCLDGAKTTDATCKTGLEGCGY